jgi:RNA polymerase sigma-70 factor (ECF subfamily)
MNHSLSSTWNSLYVELLAFVLAKVKDRPTAEDIVHDVFIKVHNKSHQVKEADKIVGWIYQITRNTVADHYRLNQKNAAQASIDWESSYHEFNECVAHCLKSLMGGLPVEYRVPLELAELDGLSQYEIADRLRISYSGARSRVQRARRLLRKKLDELYTIKTDAYGNVILCEDKIQCCSGRTCE